MIFYQKLKFSSGTRGPRKAENVWKMYHAFVDAIITRKTLEMFQKFFMDDTISKTRVLNWYKRFKEGRERVEDRSCFSR